MTTPAKQLLGKNLDGGWRVIDLVPRRIGGTGGNFSEGYIVADSEGRRGFLKALDYSRALKSADPARVLQALTEAYNFERDVLRKCRDSRMDRVVVALADGSVDVSDQPVQYLIFELADGDLRSQVSAVDRFDLAYGLRALHHVATGLSQLHRENIAHQDVKPSNVLAFSGGTVSKIADLGRAAYKGHVPPHEELHIPGDPTYAPPELLYGYTDPDWNRRRFGCDAYLMGSLVVFFFTGAGATPLLRVALRDAHSWENWAGTYEEVLPYVRDAFGHVIDAFSDSVDESVRIDLLTAVRELCEPNPALRGHPRNRAGKGNQYLARAIRVVI
jgi:serine/threonine protein kinase